MWNNKKISVALPAYNEEKNILSALNDFFSCGIVDEVIVIDNNSTDKTAELAKQTRARVVKEEKQGFGFAVQRGLREATGDYVIMCEPDGTFIANDIYKLLNYTDEFDMVLGTRTSKSCVWTGANMGIFLRWGNYLVAKLLEFIFNGPSLTDVGCTMRLIKKDALKKINYKFTVGSAHFLPEMVILAIINNFKIVEIPLNYKPRIGESKITGNFKKALSTGLKMIFLIVGYWIKNLFVK